MKKKNMITKTAGVVVFKKDCVLLVKHLEKAKNLTGIYGLPAGRKKKNETLISTASREFAEESGFKSKEENLLQLHSKFKAIILRRGKKESMEMTVYFCRKYTGSLKKSDETIPEWIEIKKLAEINLLPNVLNAIKQAFLLKKINLKDFRREVFFY